MAKIFINPGHGPSSTGGAFDPGAVGPTGLREADVNLKIGQLLNSKIGSLCTTKLYQDANLTMICNESNRWMADWFVSIHGNAAAASSAHGLETFCYLFGGQGQRLANSVQTQLVKLLGRADRGVKEGNFQVLRNTNAPAILPEIGFISNPQEEALMRGIEWQETAAEALAIGISDYIGLGYKPSATAVPEPPPVLPPDLGEGAMENLVVWYGEADASTARYLMTKLGCPGMPFSQWSANTTPAKTVYKVGGAAAAGTVLLAGSTQYETARVVLDWIAKN
ncbi:MAG: N-acetylmuramoyl-L-alanine amidase [Peptococcaceae bacterium]|nr:N-acetylmuramoyl-L-alanine amidase [Peptococcaceae bacterium]